MVTAPRDGSWLILRRYPCHDDNRSQVKGRWIQSALKWIDEEGRRINRVYAWKRVTNNNESPEPNQPASSEAPSTTCCASLSDILPPAEIVAAAENVRVWMETNGYRNWQLGGVCDRRFADECKTLHPLMHCQTCGQLRGMDHACDSLHNAKSAGTAPDGEAGQHPKS